MRRPRAARDGCSSDQAASLRPGTAGTVATVSRATTGRLRTKAHSRSITSGHCGMACSWLAPPGAGRATPVITVLPAAEGRQRPVGEIGLADLRLATSASADEVADRGDDEGGRRVVDARIRRARGRGAD